MEEKVSIRTKGLTKSRRRFNESRTDHSKSTNSKEHKQRSEIVFLSSYPPRECGIATYTSDLMAALDQKFGDALELTICPLESASGNHDYPFEIGQVLHTDRDIDYLALANWIDSEPTIDLVVVQHEFGLFSDNEKAFRVFLEMIDCPVVMTLHTVLPKPDTQLKKKVQDIVKLCDGIIVMTQTSADILYDDYGVLTTDVTVIPHGTHLVPFADRDELKRKYNLSGKQILSTFGLLGPGKSIETTLNALPGIVAEHPDTVFLILGKTHPELVKQSGEEYRNSLESIVEDLGIQDNVRFINRFLPLEELLEYLQLTDIYLFTSKDPDQAVSGTFSYAISCGCPVISTPIPHAKEVLENGSGRIFDFGDSGQLKDIVLELLEDDREREQMGLNGLRTTASSAWENSAIAHAQFFKKHAKNRMGLQYRKPVLKMDHLRNMTTEVGFIQFSNISHPDIESGYTVDDNARALIATCQHYVLTEDKTDLDYIRTYLSYILRCIRCDGQFFNYVDKDRRFTEQNDTENLDDAFGRAVWAIGYFISISKKLPKDFDHLVQRANEIFEDGLEKGKEIHSPRAIAFMIKGLYYYSSSPEGICVHQQLRMMADRLGGFYASVAVKDWHWFEKSLNYANAVLPEAMLMAYIRTLDGTY